MSGIQTPITIAALLNVCDFAPDGQLKQKASALLDRLLYQLAEHTFDGVTVGPQGDADRRVLYPHTSGSQGLLSWALGEDIVESFNPWATFLATSAAYRSPQDLRTHIDRPVSRTYYEAGLPITIHKTTYAMLSSVRIDDTHRSVDRRRSGHLWCATISSRCHVFTNHPSTPGDGHIGRPGFWHGNGVVPRVAQEKNVVYQVFDIPEDHPIGFTHAHWPLDAFVETDGKDGWHFGLAEKGLIGLWCSEPTQVESDILVERELRAWGRQVAWICVCGGADEGPLTALVDTCVASRPEFRLPTRQLLWEGQVVL